MRIIEISEGPGEGRGESLYSEVKVTSNPFPLDKMTDRNMWKHYLPVCLPNYHSVAHDDLLIVGLNKVNRKFSANLYGLAEYSDWRCFHITKHLNLEANEANPLNLKPQLVRFAVKTESMKDKSLRISSHKTEEGISVECQSPTFPQSVLHSEQVEQVWIYLGVGALYRDPV